MLYSIYIYNVFYIAYIHIWNSIKFSKSWIMGSATAPSVLAPNVTHQETTSQPFCNYQGRLSCEVSAPNYLQDNDFKKVAGPRGREGAGKIAPCNICRET